MDGIAGVQARIAEIQTQIAALAPASTPTATATATTDASAADGSTFAQALSAAQADGTTAVSGASAVGSSTTVGEVSGDAVVAEARKYLGVPYVWGGTDPKRGLDCSGLVQHVYKTLGIDLPRVSSDQARAGQPVARLADARPGDILAWDNSSRNKGADHVAIYIGNGKMIEAARPGTNVRISDVYGSPIIRRILPDSTQVMAPTTAARSTAASGGLSGVPYADLFTEAGAKFGVPAALLAAVAKTESGFNPRAVSSAGAQGLMQFMPGTAKTLGIDPLDPAQAINGAARYLSSNLREFGSVDLAIAAYNAGGGAVRKYHGVPPYPETQNYVRKVNDAWGNYR